MTNKMHSVCTSTIACMLVLFVSSTNGQYHGILINGQFGTQIYDPFNTPHAQGNLSIGLANGTNAYTGAAVISGTFPPLAYFVQTWHTD